MDWVEYGLSHTQTQPDLFTLYRQVNTLVPFEMPLMKIPLREKLEVE